MRKILKSKKGDVPIVILVLGVIAICVLTILSFRLDLGGEIFNSGLEVFEEIYSTEEKVLFYHEIDYNGLSEEEIEGLLDKKNFEVDVQGSALFISATRGKLKVDYQSSLN